MSSLLSRTDPAAACGAGLPLRARKSRALVLGLHGFTACPTTPCLISWAALPDPDPRPGLQRLLDRDQGKVKPLC